MSAVPFQADASRQSQPMIGAPHDRRAIVASVIFEELARHEGSFLTKTLAGRRDGEAPRRPAERGVNRPMPA